MIIKFVICVVFIVVFFWIGYLTSESNQWEHHNYQKYDDELQMKFLKEWREKHEKNSDT